MGITGRLWACGLILTLLAGGCAQQGPAAPASEGSRPSQPSHRAGPKRLVASVQGDVHTLAQKLNPRTAVPGIGEIEKLVAAGLVTEDNTNVFRPQLAEDVPTLENGLWKLLPDGRMETSWTLRAGARWHDGTPLTTSDLVFALMVGQDRELPAFGDANYESIEGIEAPDPRRVTVRWKQPNIKADALFSYSLALPLPRHLLQKAYTEEKSGFTDLPHWTTEFVGAGPFKLREFSRGSHMVVAANEHYVLGRPKLDEIEVRFIPDSNTLVANVLAGGGVELTLGRGLSLEQGLQVRDRWRDGKALILKSSIIHIHPQLIDPSPAIVASVDFRRALLHATDRQGLVDGLMAGLAPVAESIIHPEDREYRYVERSIVRYAYDPRRGAQMIEGLGYQKGADGTSRDASGQRLEVEIRTTGDNDIHPKILYPVVDFWRQLGVATEPVIIPTQRQRDLEYRATFPGFEMLKGASGVNGFATMHSSRAPLPRNNFLALGNYSRYMNPEYDALYERYLTTIPFEERMRVAAQIVQHVTERMIKIPLLYDIGVTFVHNRVHNVPSEVPTWNSHEWDLSS